MSFLRPRLNVLEEKGLSRCLSNYEGLVDFSSNDYLGLAQSSEFRERFLRAAHDLPAIGSTGSRLLTGNHTRIEQLEANIASYHGSSAALLFPSGYQANMSLMSTIAGKHDLLILDENCHASLVDSARLSYAKRLRFKHNDLASLTQKLKLNAANKFVVVESLYSMDGDFAPLEEIATLCKNYGAYLIVDEAHSAGLYGTGGRGVVCQLGIEKEVFARTITFGKAFGCQGGAIVGSEELKQILVNQARSFIYSTGVSLHQTTAISIAYDLIEKMEDERKKLQELITYFRSVISTTQWLSSNSAIQGVFIPGNEQVIAVSQRLKELGMLALPIRKPTVKEGMERIRICLHTFNSTNDIDQLVQAIES